ncbi:MAG: hypothetical protein HY579_01345 [Nitrospinae bacterium]|nr:hypothetical protein [Nitrospinota bacterium]
MSALRYKIARPARAAAGAFAMALLCSACAMPKHMEVRAGMDPKYEDEDVRFRAVHYFRVFDYCEGSGVRTIKADSLYRFRMTGKADSLFNKVRFESGTLDRSEIDPFGATVEYDKETNRFRHVTAEEAKKDVADQKKLSKIKELATIYQELSKGSTPPATSPSLAQIDAKIKTILDDLVPSTSANTNKGTGNDSSGDNQAKTGTAACAEEKPLKRGFQLLGPEGWTTFDQDQRLALAMSSTASPLISTLRQISALVLNEKAQGAEALLPLVAERLRISHAERSLEKDKNAPDDGVEKIFEKAIEAFERED